MLLAMIGLGKMGGNMARRLSNGGHKVVGYNLTPAETQQLASEVGVTPTLSIEDAVKTLKDLEPDQPSVVWVMVPAGEPTEQVVLALAELLSPGDIVIEGGNSFYKDSIRRAATLAQKSIAYLDVGVSGGIWGLSEGYALMIGGEPEPVAICRPIFETLAPGPAEGWGHVGPHGAGHFVKMVHNGIEYGMMAAYAEGFELLHARQAFGFDLHQISEIWRYGSVVRSWLLDLIALALADNPELEGIRGWVADSGEGRWTVMEAIENAVPAPVIALSLFQRFSSRQDESYAAQLMAALRNQFGGHAVKRDL